MQGFNKYYPPDYDGEKHKSLNAYRGKHALGDRARKIDQGILITRFELPFNIWCGGCDAHIGMGVRYNAEKRRIGSYYTTPIFAFRCKCHLCSHWFEIRTDPQNTRYVVEYGARQKIEEWNPEENGGFAVHESDPSKIPALDPLQSLEKSTVQQETYTQHAKPRLEQLQTLSSVRSADPYSLSSKLRKSFRTDKHAALRTKAADDAVRERYGLDPALKLVDANDVALQQDAKEGWADAKRKLDQDGVRKRLEDAHEGRLPEPVARTAPARSPRPVHKSHAHVHKSAMRASGSSKDLKSKAVSSLAATLASNSARKLDPFAQRARSAPKLPDLVSRKS